jgi:organic hydroperoxide reductase OsmC/OhrA
VRSVIARRGGSASRIVITATLTGEKGPEGIRLRLSHLSGRVEGLEGIGTDVLSEVGVEAERECTISAAIRGSVQISHDLTAG